MQKIIFFLLITIGIPAFTQESRRQAEQLYSLGLEALNQGKLNDAVLYFNRAIAENPVYTEAYSSRGMARERLNDNRGALMDYTLCLEIEPGQFEVLLSRAALRYQLGQYVLAREDFNKLLKLPAGETNTIYYRQSAHRPGTDQMLTAQGAIHSQLFNYLGLIELELDNCTKAIIYMDSAIQLNNLEADYYVNRALARLDCGRKDGLDDFKQALTINPDHTLARHNLAIEAARQGSYELAEQQLTETIRLDSLLLEPYLERAYYRLLKLDYRGALADYNRALSLEQGDPEILLNRGVVKSKLKDFRGAYSDFTKAIDLKPDFAKAWLDRGNLLASQLRYREAIEDYSVAITYQPDYAAAYFNRAIAAYQSGDKQKACEDLNEAIRLGITIEEKKIKQMCSGVSRGQ